VDGEVRRPLDGGPSVDLVARVEQMAEGGMPHLLEHAQLIVGRPGEGAVVPLQLKTCG